MHTDHHSYFKFTGPARLEKAANSLAGLVEGIAIDGVITPVEAGFLNAWLQENTFARNLHPFAELVPVLERALEKGKLDAEDREDLLWLCGRLTSAEFFDSATANIQKLHALMAGIMSDGVVSEEELRGLSAWLAEHDELRTCWPYDEVDSLVTSVLKDGKIDDQEHKLLTDFFSEFVALTDNRTIVAPKIQEGASLNGLCAVCPEITFEGATFCFTGASSKFKRADLAPMVEKLGGQVVNSISKALNYLVIGSEGNPCWSYACYGRKVEKAVELRKQGARIVLVHEFDFHDAVADHS